MRFHDIRFRKKWKFLLAKFQPEIWWWGQVIFIKGLLLNLGLVIFESGIEQIWWMMSTIVLYTASLVLYLPWRHNVANVVDVMSSTVLICTSALTSWYAAEGEKDEQHLWNYSLGVVLFSCLPLPGAGLQIARATRHHFSRTTRAAQSVEFWWRFCLGARVGGGARSPDLYVGFAIGIYGNVA